jgi:ferredoxin-NADP reductase
MDKDVKVAVIEKLPLIAGHIVELTLEPIDSSEYVAWEPGAHLEVVLPSGLIRHYSLCGSSKDNHYTIAVLREPESRGGSTEIHDAVNVGTSLIIRGPRNHFPLIESQHTAFLAGGIGITPLLPMMRRLTEQGKSWELHYGGKSLAALAYLDALQLMEGYEINIYLKNETRRIPVKDVVGKLPKHTTVYVCGPDSMINEVEHEGAALGLTVKTERFGSSGEKFSTDGHQDFEVTLAKSGQTLKVPADTRLIDIVRTVVPSVPFSCEEGYCGSCETGVLEGVPDHRDSILSPEEKSNNDCMMICVGRSMTPRLVLDI